MYVVTTDGVRYKFEHFQTSHFLANIHDDCGSDDDVSLPNVNSETFLLLMYWLRHPDDPIEQTWDELWAMAHAADYLHMPEMLDRTCKKLAEMLKGKSPAEIKTMLNK
jgi:hypothetical protein